MIKRRERKGGTEASLDLDAATLQGLVDAGVLMAASDGEVNEAEYDAVADVISGFLRDRITPAQIREIVEESIGMLEEQGYPGRLEALAENLRSPELREVALQVAAAVLVADGAFDATNEREAFIEIAAALDIDDERSEELLQQVFETYNE